MEEVNKLCCGGELIETYLFELHNKTRAAGADPGFLREEG